MANMLQVKPTIIVTSVGKVAFFTSFFLPSPAPGPILSKSLMFVGEIVLLFQQDKI